MGIFSRLRARDPFAIDAAVMAADRGFEPPALTPEAVSAALASSGFPPADLDGHGHPVTEGFTAHWLPVSHEDRVAVGWHADIYAYDDHRAIEATFIVDMSSLLEQVGYQTEIVDELTDSHLAVWVEGEF